MREVLPVSSDAKTQVFTRGLTPSCDCERGSPERTSASEAAAESRRGPVAFLRDGEAGGFRPGLALGRP